MDTLKALLQNIEKLDMQGPLPSDEFCLGLVLSFYLSDPSIKGARHILKHFSDVPGQCQEKVALVFYEILLKVLENTNKIDEVASLFECSASMILDFDEKALNEKLTQLFDELLERVSCEQGLKLMKYLKQIGLNHYIQEIDENTLASLDLSASKKKETFAAVVKLSKICKEKKNLTVVNSLAFQCIEFYLLYEIEDLRGYYTYLESYLRDNLDIWTYCQRLKLSEIYKNKMEESRKIDEKLKLNEDLITLLKTSKYTDPHLLKPEFQEFTFLIEDTLQFNLPEHVIRQRIKNLHGRYKGKEFSKCLIIALQAVMEDGPGFEVLNKISSVIKPMKLLSKNEFLHYKRNEKRINFQEPVLEAESKIPEIFAFSEEDVRKYLKGIDLKLATSEDIEKVDKTIEFIQSKLQNASVSIIGSYALKTWTRSNDVDITIISGTAEKSSFLSSIKYKLLPFGSVEMISSKTNPILKFTQQEADICINISVNNRKAIDIVKDFNLLISPHARSFIISVKAFAEAQNWKSSKKGYFSGFEWTILCISYMKNYQMMMGGFEENPIEKHFYRFLHFVFAALGKQVDLNNGILNEKTTSLIGILNLETGKEKGSRVKLARKQGKEFKKKLTAVLNELSFSS